MKRTVIIFALCLLVVACGVGASAWYLHQDRDQVAVTARTVKGDISAAQGFIARQSAQSQRHLLWDLTIPLGNPENTVTEFSYQNEDMVLYRGGLDPLYISTDVYFMNTDWPQEEETPALAALYREAAERVPSTGEVYTESVLLEEYTEVYPLDLYVLEMEEIYGGTAASSSSGPAHKAIADVLEEYFVFPTAPGMTWQIDAVKSPQGELEYLYGYPSRTTGVELIGDWKGDSWYCAFGSGTYPLLSYEKVPGGFGIYRMDLVREGEELKGATVETVFSLPEGVTVLDLTLSGDGSQLLVTYGQGDTYTCLVLDEETMAVEQTIAIPAQPPEQANGYFLGDDGEYDSYPLAVWDIETSLVGENFLILAGDDNFYLYSVADGVYTYEFSFGAYRFDLDSDYGGLGFGPSIYGTSPEGVWDGERLAIGKADGNTFRTPTGLTLWVFQEGELLYNGAYTTSLNDNDADQALRDAEEAEDWETVLKLEENTVWLLEDKKLSLTYEP